MSNVFVVISAIGNDYGVFSYKERYTQLLETISSVRHYSPGDEIWLYDSSEVDLPVNDVQHLKSITERFKTLKNHPEIIAQSYRTNSDNNLTGKKSVGEVVAMYSFLQDLHVSELQFDRVYKLAGRWQLTEDFSLDNHNLATNKICCKKHEFWGHEEIYPIRVWSFDFKILVRILGMFGMLYDYTFNRIYSVNMIPVLERSLYNFVTDLRIPVHPLEKIGVRGYFGQNAAFYEE